MVRLRRRKKEEEEEEIIYNIILKRRINIINIYMKKGTKGF